LNLTIIYPGLIIACPTLSSSTTPSFPIKCGTPTAFVIVYKPLSLAVIRLDPIVIPPSPAHCYARNTPTLLVVTRPDSGFPYRVVTLTAHAPRHGSILLYLSIPYETQTLINVLLLEDPPINDDYEKIICFFLENNDVSWKK
jgi:hypothetical protein